MLETIYNEYDTINSEQNQRTLTKRNIRPFYKRCGCLRKLITIRVSHIIPADRQHRIQSVPFTLQALCSKYHTTKYCTVRLSSKIHRHIFWCCHWLSFLLCHFSPHMTVWLEFTLRTNHRSWQGYLSLVYAAFNLLGNFNSSTQTQVKKHSMEFRILHLPPRWLTVRNLSLLHSRRVTPCRHWVCCSQTMKCPIQRNQEEGEELNVMEREADSGLSLSSILKPVLIQ